MDFPLLNKSLYLQFLKCKNAFRLRWEGLVPKPSQSSFLNPELLEFIQRCRDEFPKAILCPPNSHIEESFQFTMETLEKKQSILRGVLKTKTMVGYVECLEFDSEKNGFVLWDFRPVSSIKQDILSSLFFLSQLAKEIGIPVVGFGLIRIQLECTFESIQENSQSILRKEDISQKMDLESQRHSENWNSFLEYLSHPEPFSFLENSPSCRSLKNCLSPSHCVHDEPASIEIFDLRDGQVDAKTWYSKGYKTYDSIPDSELKPIQRIQKKVHLENSLYLAKQELLDFFNKLTKTVAFLDFESINPIFPLFPKTRPFQHIPFLYSLHFWNRETDEISHTSYLHTEPSTDPRFPLMQSLVEALPRDVCILSFNDFFEKRIIQECAEGFPEFSPFWLEVNSQFLDLSLPFRKLWIYHPRQNGKASLKDILPCFSETTHIHLQIKDGLEANSQFLRLVKNQVTDEEKNRVLEDLSEYCKMDTYGMYVILRYLVLELSL